MLPFYRGTVCISCLIHKDMGRLDEVSSPHGVALDVVVRAYHVQLQQRVHWLVPLEQQHLFEYESESSHDVVVHVLDVPPLDRG